MLPPMSLLAAGRLDGVRLENNRLKITPYDPLTPPVGEYLDRAIDALMPGIRITESDPSSNSTNKPCDGPCPDQST